MLNFNWIHRVSILGLLAGLTGCTVHPPGEHEERNAALRAGKPFETRIEQRQVVPLPDSLTPDQLVEYALLNNTELEQRYWEWRSAIEQIPQDGTQTTTLNLAAGTNITNGRASWGSSTVMLGNDPMTDIKWPGKLNAAARESLENAKAAGQRFTKAKYDLRSKVLSAYYDYALNAELIRLEQSNLQLLQTTAMETQAGNRVGNSGQKDVLKASNEVDISANDIASMQSHLPSERAVLNSLLSRAPNEPLPIPTEMPPTVSLTYTDEELVELAAKQNPGLIALADEIRGRSEALRLAKLQYVPDLNLSAGIDLMGITQSALGQATIPIFRYEAMNAAIAQAEANLRTSEAMRRQAGNDLTARVIADRAVIRDTDRQLDLFEYTVLPRAQEVVTIARSAYVTAQASLLDLLEDQRSLIANKREVATLKTTRGKYIAELESLTACRLSHIDLPVRAAP